jgi:hypothetical protein
MGFFTLENGTEMSILEMLCAKKVAYLNSEDEGIIHDFSQKMIEEAEEVAAYDRLFSENISRKGKNRKTKNNGKRNADKAKRLHKADRYHGKKLMVVEYKEDHEIKKGLSWLYRDCHYPVGDDVKYSLNSVKAKEKDYSLAFTGFGELLEDINYLEDRIRIYEEDIKDLEYEKAFGYLTDHGEEFLEDYKKELEELKEYKQYKEVLLRTATR